MSSTRRRGTRLLAQFAVVSALAAGAAVMAVAPASAEPAAPIPEKTIKSECKDAGGQYDTQSTKNGRTSACWYKDSDGQMNVDLYKNGKYIGTY